MTRNARRGTAGRVVAVAVVATLLLAACEAAVEARIDQVRAGEDLPALPASGPLRERARANSAEMCAAGAVSASADPSADYRPVTNAGADERVGRAPLDPSVEDTVEQARLAALEVWSQWDDDPTWIDPRWDDQAVGQHRCADGHLYVTGVVTDRPTMPSTGRYSSYQHAAEQVTAVNNLTYTVATNYLGNPQALQLDLHVPPATGEPRPLVIAVHGGGFTGGNRGQMTSTARDYARRGYVAATISYRLNPTIGSNPAALLAAALNGIDDGMEAIRWLRANAATYEIDPTRVAVVGSSAGGAVAMGTAVVEDPTPGGPLAAHSPRSSAAISTGVNLTPGLDQIDLGPGDEPILMYHYELDTVTGNTDEYAFETCQAVRNSGNACDFYVQAGSGHTISVSSSSNRWATEMGPFLWTHLGLHDL